MVEEDELRKVQVVQLEEEAVAEIEIHLSLRWRWEENDELRKVQVQEAEVEIHPRTVAHLCITHLLSFFTLSFRQDCPDGRGDDDEHAGVQFRWPTSTKLY